MRQTIWLFLAAILLSACSAWRGSGLLVFSAAGDDGEPGVQLVVTGSSGMEIRRIDLPEAPAFLFPTRAGHKGLAILQDQSVILFDAQAGTAQKLNVSGEVQPFSGQLFFGGGRNFIVLANPKGTPAYLANLETGETTDLIGLNAGLDLALGGRFSPDEAYLAIVGKDTWLLPTANPAQVRALSRGQPVFGFDFSGDSQQIVYTSRDNEDFFVIVEAADGSNSEPALVSAEQVVSLGYAPGNNRKLFLWRQGSISLLDLDSGEERELLAQEGFSSGLIPAPDGPKVLLRLRSETAGDSFALLDGQTGAAEPLKALAGLQLASNIDTGSRWLYFVDSLNFGVGRRVIALDLQTGETRQVLVLDEGSGLLGPPRPSSDGSLALASVIVAESQRIQQWLLDARGGEPRQVVEGQGSGGMISPDNRWLAVFVVEEKHSQISLYPLEGGRGKELGNGFFPIWLSP